MGLYPRWLLKLGVASGVHAGFSQSEGFAQLQMVCFPPEVAGRVLWYGSGVRGVEGLAARNLGMDAWKTNLRLQLGPRGVAGPIWH